MTKKERQAQDSEQQFTLNPYLRMTFCGDDEVVVKHGSRSSFTRIIQDDGHSKLLGKILRNVIQPTTLSDLRARNILKKEELDNAAKLVGYLRQEHVLIEPSKNLTHVYLDTIFGGGDSFSSLTIGLIGAGYLGSRIARELSRFDVGRLIIIDDREIENETIDARYFEMLPNTIKQGCPYVECLEQHLGIGGYHQVKPVKKSFEDAAELEKVAGESDFLVAALEVFSSKLFHTVNEIAIKSQKPWISIYIDGSEACIGPIYVPGETCCYNEFEIQHEASLGVMKDSYLLYKETINEGKIDGSHLVLPPYLNMTSGLGATGIMRFLLSGQCWLVGRCTRIDFERLSIDYEEVLRLPRCPACSPNRPGYRHLFM